MSCNLLKNIFLLFKKKFVSLPLEKYSLKLNSHEIHQTAGY